MAWWRLATSTRPILASLIIEGLEISAAILAGGRATRFGGADKASLLVGGTRIVERQLAALAGVAEEGRDPVDVMIVANEPDRYRALGVPIVADAIAGAGALGGLYTALLHARHDRVLVLACDLPFVSAALLSRLAAEFGTGEPVDAVVPRSARGLEPLCAVYGKGITARVKAHADRGELRLTALLETLRIR